MPRKKLVKTDAEAIENAGAKASMPVTYDEAYYHKVNLKIAEVAAKTEKNLLHLGGLLYIMYRGRGWEKLGYESWLDYLSHGIAEGRYSIAPSTASKIVGVFERWSIYHEHQLSELIECSTDNLYLGTFVLPPKHKDDCSCKDILEKCKTMSRRHLIEEFNIRVGKDSEERRIRQNKIVKCPNCGEEFPLEQAMIVHQNKEEEESES